MYIHMARRSIYETICPEHPYLSIYQYGNALRKPLHVPVTSYNNKPIIENLVM